MEFLFPVGIHTYVVIAFTSNVKYIAYHSSQSTSFETPVIVTL